MRFAEKTLALRGAVSWHRWPNERDAQWVFGGDAWDVWIAALGQEELTHHSEACSVNHVVYAECRRHAANFLAAQGPDYAAAAAAYADVADALDVLCAAWPFPAPVPPLRVRRDLVEQLRRARDAEARGVAALDAVLSPQAVSA
ncbi:MAG TPA: hypothetical protein PLZ36_18780 [Armatimonadota bacterium]|mgnify:FL=1|nr:hypothetical protein [Armatimonadota bacterium]